MSTPLRIVDTVDLNSRTFQQDTAKKYNSVTLTDAYTIEEICTQIPFSEFTSSIPVPKTMLDDFWKENHPKPTAIDYFNVYIQDIDEEEFSNVDYTFDLLDKNTVQFFDVNKIKIANYGDQRIHFQDPRGPKGVFDKAIEYNHTRSSIKLARLNEELYCFDGGGTLCSAKLRGISKVPATVCNIESEEQLSDLFYSFNTKSLSVSKFDLFKSELSNREPMARLMDRIMEDSGVHPQKNNPQGLWYTDLAPLKKMLKATFNNDETTSISGDTRKQVKNEGLYNTRRARNVVDSYEIVKSVYRDDSKKQIKSSVFQAICGFKGTFNGDVPFKKVEQMLLDYKEGLVKMPANLIDHGAVGTIDFCSQSALSASLNLTRMQTEVNWGIYCFAKLWNHYYKSDRTTSKINDDFLKQLKNTRHFAKYDKNKDYSL